MQTIGQQIELALVLVAIAWLTLALFVMCYFTMGGREREPSVFAMVVLAPIMLVTLVTIPIGKIAERLFVSRQDRLKDHEPKV